MFENVEQVAHWTVLVVDDEPDNLGVPKKVLTYYGATVYVAEDGLEGLEVLARVKPTFILLDLSMPKMDGWNMLKEVRANPKTTDIPVIALTAHAMSGDEERALEAGFDGYITKPLRLGTFLDEVARCLQQSVAGAKVLKN